MQGNVGQQVRPKHSGSDVPFLLYALLENRSRDPSCHLRTVLALELGPEPLDLVRDFEPITSRHFSRTVEWLT
jgi:hypothetical protein